MHAYLTRDGIAPPDFLRIAQAELARYETVAVRSVEIVDAERAEGGFVVTAAGGTRLSCRKLLLATGVVDEIPPLEGLEPLYGTSVHHCPYCDGWEWRDHPIAVYGRGESASGLALALRWWSPEVVLCTDGPPELPYEHLEHLAAAGIAVREDRVVRLEGRDGMLERVVFAGGQELPRSALFFSSGQRQRSDLAQRLGCRFTAKGTVDTGTCEATNVRGLYVAGDASKEAQFVSVAAAEGAEAGMAIHKALLAEAISSRQKSSSIPSRASRGGP
jgi:thioredoxin reductase